MNLNGKKLFLIGFIVVLLVGIPLTVYILQQQQNTNSKAAAATTLAFSPTSSDASPIQKNVGDQIPLDITINPGTNIVTTVTLVIQYDSSVLATASADAFKVNPTVFPSPPLDGPVYSPGKIAVTLSAGIDPSKIIQQAATLGTVTFTALKNTPPGTPTDVSFSTDTKVSSSDSKSSEPENVLLSSTPAIISIGGAATSPSVPSPSGTTPSETPSNTPSDTPTTVPSDTPAPSETPTPSGSPSANNVVPTCSSLTIDRDASGTAPYALTFTANGSDSDGTISKVTFNFGDGQVSDVTQAGGIGTASVNVQASHTYNNPGTFQATSLLTDNSGGVSTTNTCSQTVTVTAASGSAAVTNPTPTMPATGSTGITVGIGLGAMLLIIGGGLLFFVL